jgi:hypothetical protein
MSPAQNDNLLAQVGYDNDASPLNSTSDQASDSEDERIVERTRTTFELNDYDASVLREEEERENLLTKPGRFHGINRAFKRSSNSAEVPLGDQEARRQRRKKRRASLRGLKGESAEEGQLMFEMEEGFKDHSSRSSSSESLLLDRQKWNKYEKQVSFKLRDMSLTDGA